MSKETTLSADGLYVVVGTSSHDFSLLMKVDALKELLDRCEPGGMVRFQRQEEVILDQGGELPSVTKRTYHFWSKIPPAEVP